MPTIEMEQSHTIEHLGLEERLRGRGGHEDDLPRTITLPHQDGGTGRLLCIEQMTCMAMGMEHSQGCRYRTACVFIASEGL